jgi:hypothetical protein
MFKKCLILGLFLAMPSMAFAGITLTSDTPVNNSVDPQIYQYYQSHIYWAATGIRPDSGSDWDMALYTDTLCTQYVASSALGGSAVDFVISDYNHSPIGWNGVRVSHWAGTGNCAVEYDDGTDMLIAPAGGTYTWAAGHVVQCWDAYVVSGQSYTYTIRPLSSNLDFGIAIFQSNGAAYYAGRSDALQSSDYEPAGFAESFTFTATATDFYGLVIWSNNNAGGDYQLDIEHLPTLVSDIPVHHGQDLPWYYKVDKNAPYWYTASVMPNEGGIANVWFASDTNFSSYVAYSSYSTDSVNFVVADGNRIPDGYYGVASWATNNFVPYNLEFQSEIFVLSKDQLNGPFPWTGGHVAHAFDLWLDAGQTATYTLSMASGLTDLNMSLFRSTADSTFFSRSMAVATAASAGPGNTERFTYTAPTSGYYGLIVWARNLVSGSYYIDISPLASLPPETPTLTTRYIQDYKIYTHNIYWAGVAVRPDAGSDWDIWLYSDTLYSNLLASSAFGGSSVDFVVGDFNHSPLGWLGVYTDRFAGTGNGVVEYADSNLILTIGNTQVTWGAGHIFKVWDVYLTSGQTLDLQATPSSTLDIGVALFASNGAAYYAGRGGTVRQVDANGPGGSERINYVAPATDYYGLVLWSNAGDGTVNINASTGIDDQTNLIPTKFEVDQNYPNPFNAQTALSYALPKGSMVTIEVYDLLGRKVETLLNEEQQAGYHRLVWDASNQTSGIYFYRIKAGEMSEIKKMVLVK